MTIEAVETVVTEGEEVPFTVTANPAPAANLVVSLMVTETGDTLVDSESGSQNVTIEAEQTTATLTVTTDDDDKPEDDRTVTATVNNGTGYTIGSSKSAEVTVADNDGDNTGGGTSPPQITPPPTPPDLPQVTIEGDAVSFTVKANPPAAADLVVSLMVTETGNTLTDPGPQNLQSIIVAEHATATLTVTTVLPEPLVDARRERPRRDVLQLAFAQTEQRLVGAIGEHQVSAAVEHGDGVAGGVEHRLQPAMTAGELPLVVDQFTLHVPFPHQGHGDLLDLFVYERLPDVQQLVQQFLVVHDLGQRPVGVGGHDHDLDLAVDPAYPADRLDAVDTRRHPDVDVGHGDGEVPLPAPLDDVAGLLASACVQQLQLRQKRNRCPALGGQNAAARSSSAAGSACAGRNISSKSMWISR